MRRRVVQKDFAQTIPSEQLCFFPEDRAGGKALPTERGPSPRQCAPRLAEEGRRGADAFESSWGGGAVGVHVPSQGDEGCGQKPPRGGRRHAAHGWRVAVASVRRGGGGM
ncbi:uncharacterized protein Tco025E_00541 [Trypanosoma conorhini]|uniref:Uncharacterized protein n=1 Tax=Trypanosoma conorhini TaxID=83891 RepID=A0A422QB64_9TRYP|nr:uncharacterized protein Tco025E_00541 [Trypanosoma conorhini]RNF27233.1 hypothetical protein Tco025E_00541 [Trypanosoma conorhini]